MKRSGLRASTCSTQPAKVIGALQLGGVAVAGQVERQRAIAFRVERRDHAVPRVAGAAEAVQQDDALRHARHPMTADATDRHVHCCCARSWTSSRAAACARRAPRPARATRRWCCRSRASRACAATRTSTSAARAFFALGAGEGRGPAGGGGVHVGDRRRGAGAGGDRGARGAGAAAAADRRPPGGAARNGAGQAIDQLKLFGDAAKWFFEVGTAAASAERLRWMRTLACRAYWTALRAGPGAVHLNFPLREPLVSDERLPHDASGRADGAPYVRSARPSEAGTRRGASRSPAPASRSCSPARGGA